MKKRAQVAALLVSSFLAACSGAADTVPPIVPSTDGPLAAASFSRNPNGSIQSVIPTSGAVRFDGAGTGVKGHGVPASIGSGITPALDPCDNCGDPGGDDPYGEDDYTGDPGATIAALNLSGLPPGAYLGPNGTYYDQFGNPLSWCGDCANGAGEWISTIGQVQGTYATNGPSFTVEFGVNSAAYNGPIIRNLSVGINLVCLISAPFCKNIPLKFSETNGVLHNFNSRNWPAGTTQQEIINDVTLDISAKVWTGVLRPGMINFKTSCAAQGFTIGYAVTFLGTISAPEAIYVATVYPL